MPKTWPERNEMYDDYDQFWNSSSSNDEDDPLDSIVRTDLSEGKEFGEYLLDLATRKVIMLEK